MNGLLGIQSETLNDDLSVRVDSNRVAFRFRAITICDEFTSGSALRFIINAQNPCEETISSNLALTDPLIIEDVDPADFAQIVTFADPSAVNYGEMGTINFTVANTCKKVPASEDAGTFLVYRIAIDDCNSLNFSYYHLGRLDHHRLLLALSQNF